MIANGGVLYRPHLVRGVSVEGTVRSVGIAAIPDSLRRDLGLPQRPLALVRDAMVAVVEDPHGTGGAAQVDSVVVAGKTGTAQNPHGEDHALFICFAPVAAPRIVIAVLVENAGHGATAAAPIAHKILEAFFHPAAAESAAVVAIR
jgi:penicillin-binding protein 2